MMCCVSHNLSFAASRYAGDVRCRYVAKREMRANCEMRNSQFAAKSRHNLTVSSRLQQNGFLIVDHTQYNVCGIAWRAWKCQGPSPMVRRRAREAQIAIQIARAHTGCQEVKSGCAMHLTHSRTHTLQGISPTMLNHINGPSHWTHPPNCGAVKLSRWLLWEG